MARLDYSWHGHRRNASSRDDPRQPDGTYIGRSMSMQKNSRCFILLVCFQGLTAGGASLSAGEPSAQDLIQRTPVIKSGAKDYESIEIEGYLKVSRGVFQKFRSAYRAPHRYALIISD